jgi:hypothetical protein
MRRKIITSAERDHLAEIARKTNFRDRALVKVLRSAGFPEDRVSKLRKEIIGQKRLDALIALRNAHNLIELSQNNYVNHSWTATNTFIRDLDASHIDIKLISTY